MSQSKTYYIFLIHGWGGSANSLQPLRLQLVEQLAKAGVNNLQTQLIELPGFGQTPLAQVFSLADYVSFVRERINERLQLVDLKHTEVLLIGHSFGGKILLQLGIEQSFPATRLVLINASGIFPNNTLKKRLFKLISLILSPVKWLLLQLKLHGLLQLLRKAFYKYLVGARDYQKINNPLLAETFKQVVDSHINETNLAKLANPTLLIWGEQDKDTPLWMAEKIAANLPNATLKIVPNATHGLPLKQPELCAELVSKWLDI